MADVNFQPLFPADWIAPSEFSYCGRCGLPESVTEGNPALPCALCAVNPWMNPCPTPEQHAAAQLQAAKALALNDRRSSLASSRRAAGLPPRFWTSNERVVIP